MSERFKPTREQIQAATALSVPDIIAKDLKLLFVGINPGLYSAAIGHHFGRPGNRFWPALHAGRFTPRLFSPFDEAELLPLGFGITNLVDRATALADELSNEELREGGKALRKKIIRWRPRAIAILGVGAVRGAFDQKIVKVGPQPDRLEGAEFWVLPNPSGLNAHYQPAALAQIFGQLRDTLDDSDLTALTSPI